MTLDQQGAYGIMTQTLLHLQARLQRLEQVVESVVIEVNGLKTHVNRQLLDTMGVTPNTQNQMMG